MKVHDILRRIDACQQEIDAHGKFEDTILKKINYKFRLDWNYYSNRMEGGTLTREETRSVMTGIIDVQGKPMKDVLEMQGHNQIVLDILKMGKGDMRLAEKRIKAIHSAIMHEEDPAKLPGIGNWKLAPNEIINYKSEKIPFTPPAEVPEKVHSLLDITNAELDKFFRNAPSKHPLEIAAQFHIDFVSIHPFYDGNGRTTRILTNILLISCGFPPIIIKEKHKEAYYQLLADIQVYGGQPDLFYTFLGERLLESQQLMLDAIAGKEIEEEEDLYKEIKLWKNQFVQEESAVLEKNNELINEVYLHSVKLLFEQFLEKHTTFDELFLEKKIEGILNNSKPENWNLEFLENRFNENNFRTTNQIGLIIFFSGFKKNGVNIFDEATSFKVTFDKFHYLVSDRFDDTKQYFRKLYSEKLSTEEINQFVNLKVKELFESIKNKLDQK